MSYWITAAELAELRDLVIRTEARAEKAEAELAEMREAMRATAEWQAELHERRRDRAGETNPKGDE